MTTAIRIENLSKRYLLGHQRKEKYVALRDVLMHQLRGVKQRVLHPLSQNREDIDIEEFWALKDINLEIKQGDRVGIIGHNGAGKSTLLKILSRIVEPTSGKITLKGRVSSLLEVGTGFHPELTGRENIYLNGAILGMRRNEIKRKFDEIVAFAEVEKFLDTPVKRYSSGMYVRLAFSVAAHLEPEILIVDEVLAVGDMAFQNKCVRKMGEFSTTGMTLLVVSHNIAVISRLCNRGIVLQSGYVNYEGSALDAASRYSEITSDRLQTHKDWPENAAPGDEVVRLLSIGIHSEPDNNRDVLDIRHPIIIEFTYKVYRTCSNLNPAFFLYNQDDIVVFISSGAHDTEWVNRQRQPGLYKSRCYIPGNFLAEGSFYIRAIINARDAWNAPVVHVDQKYAVGFKIYDALEGGSARGDHSGAYYGVVRPILEWSTTFNE
ncbi:MAG: ABC transporter ATP-binding protein [Gammaproteobacteria bacterium]|nr:ABC transporter ATP-binding protein [Gammaproteobacteria bacterium]